MLPRANSKAPPKPRVPPPPTATRDEPRRRRSSQQPAETNYTQYVGVLRSEYEQLAKNVDRWNEKYSTKSEIKRDSPIEKTPRIKAVDQSSGAESVTLTERTSPISRLDDDKLPECVDGDVIQSADAQSKTKPKTPEHVSQWSNSVSSRKLSVSPRIGIESLRPMKVMRQQRQVSWGTHTNFITRNNPTFVNRLIPLPPLVDAKGTVEKRPQRSPRENVEPNALVEIEDTRRPGKRSERSPRENVAENSSEHEPQNSDRMTPPKKRQTQSDVRNIFAVPRIPRRTKDRRSVHGFSRLKPISGRYAVNRAHGLGRARWVPYRPLPRISGKRQTNDYLMLSQYSAGERSQSDMTEVPKLRTLLEKRLEKLWFGAKTKFQMLSGKRRINKSN
ncbi:hypothetical protein LSAT2_011629 [Lamellibrachia satsuma]|nr:hypothetical protein LSAT2_011629 [Lamellibrachia satsuma]